MQPRCAMVASTLDIQTGADGRVLEEAIYDTARATLADAGIGIDDIDGIVVAGNDQVDGRAISIMAASGSVGGVGRDIMSTRSSAEHALVLAALRIASGQFQSQLVVSWSSLEVESISYAQHLANDPYYHRALPLDEQTAGALQATAIEARAPHARAAAELVARKNREHGRTAYPAGDGAAEVPATTSAWPLTDQLVRPYDRGVVATVLASPQWLERHPIERPAWIAGIGWATERAFLGDRDLSTLPSLSAAAAQAYRQARVEAPATHFDIAELADYTPYQELLAYESLGLCAAGDWLDATRAGRFAQAGHLPVNLSGGAQTRNPFFCTGLARIIEAGNQVRGRAGRHQRAGVRRALAHAASGPAMQYNTVVVFHADIGE